MNVIEHDVRAWWRGRRWRLTNSSDLDPFFEAIGRLITACQVMEFWIYLTVSTLDRENSFHDAEKKLGAKNAFARLGETSSQLPPSEHAELQAALGVAAEVLETRHQLVHGIRVPTTTPRTRVAMRPSRDKADRNRAGDPLWIRGHLTRERMLTDRDHASQVSGLLQGRMMRWAECLGVDDDTPPSSSGN